MKIIEKKDFSEHVDLAIVFTIEKKDEKKIDVFSNEKQISNEIVSLYKQELYQPEKNHIFSLYNQGKFNEVNYVHLKVSNKENCGSIVREAINTVLKSCKRKRTIEVDVTLTNQMVEHLKINKNEVVSAIVEGFVMGSYSFSKYCSQEENKIDKKHEVVLVRGGESLSNIKSKALISSEAVNWARDLVNEPPNVLTTEALVESIKEEAKKLKVKINVLNEKQLKKLQMGGLLAVNSGSSFPARMVHLSYQSDKKGLKNLLLVGKGIVYDSGGLSLKTGGSLLTMKSDMAGAAAVLGAFKAIVELKLKVNVDVLVPITDNMINSHSYRVDDVLKMHSGKTVEVHNTDAEGRLILADALSYGVDTLNPDYVVNLATLTGSCIVSLGHYRAGLFSNSKELQEELFTSGEKVDEKVWNMPLDDIYFQELKSSIADMKNVGSRAGGSITAAKFLEQFVKEKPWAHLDIAATGFLEKKHSYYPKGGTGFGVRLLVDFAKKMEK